VPKTSPGKRGSRSLYVSRCRRWQRSAADVLPLLYFGRARSGSRTRLTAVAEPGFWELNDTTTTEIRGGNNGTGALTWQPTDVTGLVAVTPRGQHDRVRRPRPWPGQIAADSTSTSADRRRRLPGLALYYDRAAPDCTRVERTVVSHRRRRGLTRTDVTLIRATNRAPRPVGGYFVWEPPLRGPLLLVAGGSGVAPLIGDDLLRAAAERVTPAAAFLTRLGRQHLPRRLERLNGNVPHGRAHV